MKNFSEYEGWELPYFDKAKNFRNYQLKILQKHINGTVAEIGPGNGSLCENYINSCDKLILFEPSNNLYQNLVLKFKNNLKIQVINEEFNSLDQKFDCVLLMDVIEHIEHPSKLIMQIYSCLNKNGKILINVPAFQHLYSNFDKDIGHIKRYDKKSFMNMINTIPNDKVSMFYYDSIGYFLSLFSKLLFNLLSNFGGGYKKNFKQKIIVWDLLMPISKFLDKIILNKIGKSLFIVIHK